MELATETIPTVNFNLIAGPQLLGFMFNWALLGVLSVQVYIYYLCFPADSIAKKTLVYGLFVAEIAQTALVTSDAFQNFVYGFGSPLAFAYFYTSWFSAPIMTVISAIIQICFGWRIYVLAKSYVLSGIVVLLALGQACAGIVTGVRIKALPDTEHLEEVSTPILVWLVGSALVDVVIAAAMTFLLMRMKNGMSRSNLMINRIVALVVETGSVTATVAIVEVVLFKAIPNTLLYQCTALVQAKVYTNTLLTVFNSRALLERGAPSVETSSIFMRRMNARGPQATGGGVSGFSRRADRGGTNNTVHIDVFHETVRDRELNEPKSVELSVTSLGKSAGIDESV